MNPRKLIPTQEPGVLDFAPGAAAAFSLRNLSYTYAGPVVTVRRGTDNAEADFTATEVSDGTLAAWCGGGDGYVKQWWDQSGNARHATQATAGYQPKIADSGVVVTEGGKAAVRFATTNAIGLNIRLQTPAFSAPIAQPVSTFLFCKRLTTDDRQYPVDGRQNQMSVGGNTSSGVYEIASGSQISSTVPVDTASNIFSGLFNGALSEMHLNGAIVVSGDAGTNALDGITIGNLRGVPAPLANNYTFIGTIAELIIYPTDMTALRTRIEGNIAWYY